MFEIFIRRPILSGVISVVIVFLGLLAITSLPITQFPDIVPPSVTVTARYTGANADVMAKTVATPLERAINGVPGMTYMTTVCTNDGMSLTTIYFKVGTDPDVASVNVQNRVTTVLDELPEEVIRAGVITEKEVNSMLMYLNIMSTDSSHTEKFVYNFADINILRELKRIDGVGFVEIMGSRDYAMRVWLNPNRLAAYNMSPQEVTAAIRSQNIEAAPGKTGISSDKIPQQLQYVLQYSGKFSTPEEYGEIVLKALPDGSVLRLKDVATIEFDSEDYNMISMTDGKPSASIMIKQRPGSNAREEKESGGQSLVIFAICLVFVYLLLAAQYESLLLPLPVILSLPAGVFGSFLLLYVVGLENNIYAQVALVMLIGLLGKNAILIIEVANQCRKEGVSIMGAAIQGATSRLRPILMTSFAFISGLIPLAVASGAGALGNRSIGTAAAGGMLIGTFVGIFLIPGLYVIFESLATYLKEKKQKANEEEYEF